ncbi:HK97-gp10 family putative phage morphogenesis protein [Liquorilactobacillus uvarum]|uniref:HK97-gp10 family putative phage morphogenesis protein n=1 Tax=Liquorilactobacillus uvarum TaxID=303240 RepID=UPI00288A5E5D|nr:HK97-gp10 family putative phage morphogenesis protein [Liquorilactobacillus uvarum]
MAGLDDALNEFMRQVKEQAELSVEETQQVTKAGAEVYKDELYKATKEKHYSNHKDEKHGHMADSIISQDRDIDGDKNGKSTVGFDSYHAQNARRLNDGTKKYKADHFVTNVQDSPEVQEKVLRAEYEVYKKITKGKE